MIPIETMFIGLMIMFGIMGALRGWAKELLVVFSVVLARFVEFVLWQFIPVIKEALRQMAGNEPQTWFYIRSLLFVVFVAFGYATTTISADLGQKARKEKFQDTLLGFFLGAINGFLVIGMLWGFLANLGYDIWGITGPTDPAIQNFMSYLPLTWLEGPTLFIAVALSFAFVLIVFV